MADSKNTKPVLYRCKYCGIGFREAADLIAHKKTTHLAQIKEAWAREQQELKRLSQDKITLSVKNGTSSQAQGSNARGAKPPQLRVMGPSTIPAAVPPAANLDDEGSECEQTDDQNEENEEDTESGEYPVVLRSTSPVSEASTVEINGSNTQNVSNEGFQCPVCDATFSYDYQLAEHMTNHPPALSQEAELQTAPPASSPLVFSASLPQSSSAAASVKVIQNPPKKSTKRTRAYGIVRTRTNRHKCRFCPKVFRRPSRLKQHILFDHSQSAVDKGGSEKAAPAPAAFPVLKFKWSRESTNSSPQPKSKEMKRKTLKCKYCAFSSIHHTSVRRHQRRQHGTNSTFGCFYCPASFASRQGRAWHCGTEHPSEESSPQNRSMDSFKLSPGSSCHLVGKPTMKNLSALRPPQQLKRSALCGVCKIEFKSQCALYSHYRSAHPVRSRLCPYCPYVSMNRNNVDIHIRRIHANRYGPEHECHYCGARCVSDTYLTRHIKQVHEGDEEEEPITSAHSSKTRRVVGVSRLCPDCPFIAECQSSLLRHVNNVHPKVRRKYQCNYCSASYQHLVHFYSHKKLHPEYSQHEPKNSSFQMRASGKVKGSSSRPLINPPTIIPTSLKLNGVGGGSRKYCCKICEAGYSTARCLRRHYGTQAHIYNQAILRSRETGTEMPNPIRTSSKLECELCQMLFLSRLNLSRHIAKKHFIVAKVPKQKYDLVVRKPSSSHCSSSNSSRGSAQYQYHLPLNAHYSQLGSLTEKSGGSEVVTNLDNGTNCTDSSSPNKNTKIVVTHNNQTGLKITTVKFG